jgi:hypothetical protein
MTRERCPCIHPDLDPELGEEACACGNALDEHDDTGQCQAEVEY